MDDLAFGRLVKLARLRRHLRQLDLARQAGASRTTVSRLERGHLGETTLAVLRRIASPLEIRIEVQPRARALDLDRIVNARHAALADHLSKAIGRLPGWVVRPEVSYSEYGERGVIDLLCWHAGSRSLLVIEVKTELMEFGELLGKLDAKDRLAPTVARRFGWSVGTVSVGLLVADSSTNRRRAALHASLLGSALPNTGPELTRWLRRPSGTVRALRYVPDARPGHVRAGFAAPTRIRTRRQSARAA